MLGTLRYDNREALFTALGRGEATLPDYLAKSLRPASSSIFSKILRPLKGKKSQNTDIKTPTKRKVNMKETYVLEYDEKNGHNFRLCDCCSPVPGDDVMGWVNDDGEVELHALSCPRASVLKASYGKRILNTRWAEQSGLFLAEVRIEGIDRFGILQGNHTDDIDASCHRHTQAGYRGRERGVSLRPRRKSPRHQSNYRPFAPSSEIYAVCSVPPVSTISNDIIA